MTIGKKLTSMVLAASLASAGLMPLATSANARDMGRNWDGGARSARVDHDWDGDNRGRGHRWRHFDRRDFGRHHRRGHDHTGRNLAIGTFAAIVGLAIAAEASRSHRRDYDRYAD